MIKASDLPPPLIHGFIDALEAWGLLEHELFMTWQFLNRTTDLAAAWENFSRMSTERQRTQTIKLVEAHLEATKFAPEMPNVFERLEALTKTRDRIVHGRWHKIHGRESEYIRLYDARGEPARPANSIEEQPMLGRSRFYEDQLREAESQFRLAARDLHMSMAGMISWRSRATR